MLVFKTSDVKRANATGTTIRALEKWLTTVVKTFAEHILPIDQTIADEWGRMGAKRPVRRPVFTMWDRKPLMETCTFLSYDRVKEIRDLKHLADTNESIVARYEEQVTIQN